MHPLYSTKTTEGKTISESLMLLSIWIKHKECLQQKLKGYDYAAWGNCPYSVTEGKVDVQGYDYRIKPSDDERLKELVIQTIREVFDKFS